MCLGVQLVSRGQVTTQGPLANSEPSVPLLPEVCACGSRSCSEDSGPRDHTGIHGPDTQLELRECSQDSCGGAQRGGQASRATASQENGKDWTGFCLGSGPGHTPVP